MRAVDGPARAIGAEWRIIYNDFAVARAINREFGRRQVIFVGQAWADKKGRLALYRHGPAPLILHFHLDLEVREGSERENGTSGWEGKGNDFSPYLA